MDKREELARVLAEMDIGDAEQWRTWADYAGAIVAAGYSKGPRPVDLDEKDDIVRLLLILLINTTGFSPTQSWFDEQLVSVNRESVARVLSTFEDELGIERLRPLIESKGPYDLSALYYKA